MKVKDLIEQLQALDPELMVVRSGYEGGVTEVEYAVITTIALNVHDEWYYGEHEEVDTEDTYPDHKHAQAVELS
ncbi:hypothetical protein UFOVP48_34 [uncultured Caudovirales phage]|uniref:Uncharacterized protein n=1 Tax=uncultured Caudovirales phage TaxID=2100421 RepID=A0A6J5KTM3_9CAUD|nr:hypothetical protein UFOVP48_34 [uncultured Caudovirales phage]